MKKKFCFNVKDINKINQYDIITKDIYIYDVSTVNNPYSNTLIFVNDITESICNKLKTITNSLIILNVKDRKYKFKNNTIICVERPRKEYARILNFILSNQNRDTKINYKDGYCFGQNVEFKDGVYIEPFVFIGNNVVIGNNTIIRSGTKIRDNVVIGDNCILRENCVIGGEGFGVERDDDGITYKIPHLGGVIIGNNVEIGALTSVAQGTIEPTLIDDYVKIDDNVFIAHNCKIGKGTYVIANAEISGSTNIGKMCWIGPSTSIINTIKVKDGVTTGIGSVIIKDVEANSTIAGNPAEDTRYLKQKKNALEKLINKKF